MTSLVIAGDVLQTYIFIILVVCAIFFAVYAWTFYEDKGLPIIKTSLHDVIHRTYVIWRKEDFQKS